MKIQCHTVCSPSHRTMLDMYMIPSFPHNSNLSLHVQYINQLCTTAEYESEGWHDTMKAKALSFLQGVYKAYKEGAYYMYIDADILHMVDWYDHIINYSKGYDMVFQNDWNAGLNTGFFLVKPNQSTIDFFSWIYENLPSFSNEQKAVTHACKNKVFPVKWATLPDTYWNYGINKTHWDGTTEYEVPKDAKIVHANWTTSFDLKYRALMKAFLGMPVTDRQIDQMMLDAK